MFCGNSFSQIYFINSDRNVSERISAFDFSEKVLVKKLTDKNLYELTVIYGRVGNFMPNYIITITIKPNAPAGYIKETK